MYTLLLSIGIILMCAAIYLMVQQKLPACLFAYAALCALHFSSHITLPVSTFIFWGIVSVILVAIDLLSPKGEPDGSCQGNLYMTIGAMAGVFIGISINPSIMVLCAIIGTIFGQLAYSRTPKGCWIKFPSSIFIHYFCAKGFKIVASAAMLGIALVGFLLEI